MAAISFDTEYTITTAAPGLIGKALYSVDSEGNVTMTVYMRCNSNGAWANDPWCAWVNGGKQQIKARTSGTLGKTWYSTTYSLGKTYSGTIKWSSYNNNSGTTEYSWSIPTPTWNVVVRISNMDVYGNYGSSWVWVNENVQRGNSVSYTAYSGDATYNAVSYSNSKLTGNVDTTLYASRKTGTFNLNILMPDDVTEPYQTGRAGTVQMSTDGGSTWTGNIYNEPASSYYVGRSLKFRNFYPGEGLKYKSVSGVDGNWAATQGSALTVNFYTAYESYYLDLNGMLDGTSSGGLGDYGRATVVVNGATVGNQVSDYYAKHPYDQSYSITNITPLSGYRYNGVYSGSTSGTIGLGKSVVLSFSTIEPSNLQINGSATSPFTIDLSWSATGINITNYTVYYNGVAKNCGTSTSTTLEVSEETAYNIYFTATNAGGTTTSSPINITTPSDQAKIRIKGKGLPDTLQRVEYIQTDGAQLINLGKVGDSVSQYDIQFIADNHRQLMGYGGSGSEYWGATDTTIYEAGGQRGSTTDTTQRRNITWTYSYRDGISKVEYDGVTVANGNGASKNVDTDDYKLFNISADASAQYGCACKLYGLTIYHYDKKVHELIPCYRKSDGVIGLYDVAEGKFYTNEGSGNFAKGPDMEIGEGWLKGKVYLKINGVWTKAKKIYIKIDGQWKIGSNYES